ncbi:hypothetical protein BaRGS_00035588 [Batillaria attramentaria]|uniref:Uncharacterized protein n=1 Tax=Batillaria attramentaria TaxID=370345 RepID=A0ABD0JE42_9CAEN
MLSSVVDTIQQSQWTVVPSESVGYLLSGTLEPSGICHRETGARLKGKHSCGTVLFREDQHSFELRLTLGLLAVEDQTGSRERRAECSA